ncbi:hypothetical protein Desmer_2717 [Desulfosporosinus meridiei DSM 13257]|uniref:Uncharacterized protein n=2 Tax=Desulfosporosinus TaxID=79206 RepID=J7IZW9_DESMD|nr:hypothetical protein Desmer_2717 [Desulfosporosinus meridiei DSM 13257]
MGVLYHYVVDSNIERSTPPFPSVRMAQLFYEFLRRYNEWKYIRRQETIGMFVVLTLGFLALTMPWLFPKVGIVMSLAMFILFYFAARHYIKLNEQVCHLYVNVHILHHHLTGKLEVGFCDHRGTCQCAEDFRVYVLKKYNICFDDGFPLR